MIAITLRMTRAERSALGSEEDNKQCKEVHLSKQKLIEVEVVNRSSTEISSKHKLIEKEVKQQKKKYVAQKG